MVYNAKEVVCCVDLRSWILKGVITYLGSPTTTVPPPFPPAKEQLLIMMGAKVSEIRHLSASLEQLEGIEI